jgi:formylglycine-generating enzyme required for sulfatase activity
MHMKQTAILLAAAMLAAGSYADVFGTGPNQFELTFQNISSGSNPSSGYGQVGYDYGIGTHEISADQWQKYMNLSGGPVGSGSGYSYAPTTSGSQAVNYASWNEAAQFVNWLNTSSGHQAAYSFDGSGNMSLWGAGDQSATSAFRHKDAVYVLPSEDEWVKAAYWNGTSLQTYATPGDTLAGMNVNYNNNVGSIWNVGSGTEEINGTYDMMGNVWEWNESGYTAPDDSATENRVFRGGAFNGNESDLRSSIRYNFYPTTENLSFGFRVAAIPEPSSIALIGLFGGLGLFIRRYFPSV